jgi:subtilisin family serine protease
MATRKQVKKPARQTKAKQAVPTGGDTFTAETDQASQAKLPQSDPEKKPFVPTNLDRTVIAIPLLNILREEESKRQQDPKEPPKVHPVIIDLNLEFEHGRDKAREWIVERTMELVAQKGQNKDSSVHGINKDKSKLSQQYLFARLEGDVIRELVKQDAAENAGHKTTRRARATAARAIYHIWPDFKVRPLTNRSISTVKADAAHASFSAFGQGIVWAVMDTGIDVNHPHFTQHSNVALESPLEHMDFTGEGKAGEDPNGHGTHVAGIIAGEMRAATQAPPPKRSKRTQKLTNQNVRAFVRNRDENGEISYELLKLNAISGMAPRCKLLSLRVLDEAGNGEVSSLIAAIEQIQEINGYGRHLLIHGVNISIGNDFEPEWFACGQSPLCVEVNRLVNSGVVVVAAAGNSGYGSLESKYVGTISAGLSLTINDPGNAEDAITVGSTHRHMPHVYGVSYFSSKGPTGDGRPKPDLVAPGEKIISCATGKARAEVRQQAGDCLYVEDSGTSMAAPHVSGVIAAFLSIRREFIGQPKKVKEIFLSTATDLRRERYFQGNGLVDLMRAIQSV